MKSGKDVGKVLARRDLKPATAFYHGEDGGHAGAGVLTADVDPVFAASGYRAHRIFRQVVAKLQLRMIEEMREALPKRERVAARLARFAAGQRRLACGQDVLADLIKQRRSLLVGSVKYFVYVWSAA